MSLVPDLPPAGRAAVRAGVVGNYVDQVNIFLPVVALAPALVTLAGPHAGVTSGALVVVATLLGRPVGAMVFGRIADRVGRTRTTQVAIAGTAACSLLIAAVPTHASVGVLAIGAVVLLRFVGGVFLAGEYTSAIPLAMEWSPPRRRGLVSGLIMSMAPWAQSTIAFATAALLALLGPATYAEWGWRLSFVAGGLASLALLAFYSARVADAPHVVRQREQADTRAPAALGLRAVLGGAYAGAFWQMFGLMSGLWLMTNMVVIAATGRLAADHGLDGGEVATVMGVASVAQALVMSTTGHWSTVLGRRRYFVGWGLAAAVLAPLLWLATMTAAVLPFVVGVALLQVVTVCGYGPVGAYLCERFPAHVRSTGYGTAYSLSIVVPALWPWWLPRLEPLLGHDGAVVAVLVVGGLLVAGCGALGPRLARCELDDDVEAVAVRSGTLLRPGVPSGATT
ncbi:Major Facilitator Superfamily transporter [Janibacter hoylei PVAS-1]|uniref:MFS transporter n=1 Tax=Janibacter hoylei PVAS-1 TaxID=1210046 RepID=K1E6Z3_9MICO|nr:MFS transporter [Janibacter hoylei]EKA62836.1 Major Facilitator Superfamily transporter [Janibacter hoylei PVAS-1]RWU82109.1 MFS transporter [Janibacter hoylei PVAS-1]